ncbi:hypothetical protein [Bifidobacterium panos]|uniref:Terminase n=1 Tax=Bifidobacterium panos TaxID=2675321 RepID=A0ABX1T1Q0_9BIFI|nr:hypothetical protein [Bifidobacterium sp. DSM 109963]NMN02774.1 hypothetical protein [Bifidobacterium sp. DSM 109963]
MAGNSRGAQKRGNDVPVLRKPGEPLGPELPENLLKHDWLPWVRQQYELFRSSPQAALLRTDVMWTFAVVAFAELNEMFVTGRFGSMGPEVRQMFAQVGWSPLSLRALKIDVPEPDDLAAGDDGAAGNVVVDFEAFRKRMEAAG